MIIEPRIFGDQRGRFLETYHYHRYREAGIDADFVQDNCSQSSQSVLRGLHFQRRHPQGKLIWVTSGAIFDVAVDLRQSSETFGKWFGARLDADRLQQIFIPPGFAHGFCVLTDQVELNYKCTEYYHSDDEDGLRWNDPDIGIDWPIDNPVLSDRDRALPSFKDVIKSGLIGHGMYE